MNTDRNLNILYIMTSSILFTCTSCWIYVIQRSKRLFDTKDSYMYSRYSSERDEYMLLLSDDDDDDDGNVFGKYKNKMYQLNCNITDGLITNGNKNNTINSSNYNSNHNINFNSNSGNGNVIDDSNNDYEHRYISIDDYIEKIQKLNDSANTNVNGSMNNRNNKNTTNSNINSNISNSNNTVNISNNNTNTFSSSRNNDSYSNKSSNFDHNNKIKESSSYAEEISSTDTENMKTQSKIETLTASIENTLNINNDKTHNNDQELNNQLRPLCFALLLVIFCSIFQAAFFAYVTSSNNREIEQILYFVRLFSDLFGRPLTLLPRPYFLKSRNQLLAASLIRIILLVLFFIYILFPSLIPRIDALIIAIVCIFSLLSGYFTVLIYEYAAVGLNKHEQTNVTRILNLYFQSACFFAVLLSLFLTSMGWFDYLLPTQGSDDYHA